MMMEAMTF